MSRGLHATTPADRAGRAPAATRLLVAGLVLALCAALAAALGASGAPASGADVSARSVAAGDTKAASGSPSLAALTRRFPGVAPRAATEARSLPATRRLEVSATPCGKTPGLLCSDVVVPLDRSGLTPGTVALHVETLPALGTQRGVMFLVAGGPGQGSARVFGLSDPSIADNYRFLFPGYTLVAFDNRGTGASGVLRCPTLQAAFWTDQQGPIVSACAATLGPGRVFYGTDEHVEDTDAVRQALGFDRIAIWGTSYGTKLAVAYAYAHPDRVERLLLDSVVPADRDDPFGASSLRAIPRAWSDYCAGGICRSATSNASADIVRLANRLGAKPIQGKVLLPNGSSRAVRVAGSNFIGLVIDADLSPGLAAELPAVARAALQGNTQPLLRAFLLDQQGSIEPAEELSSGLFAATVCADGPFPWPPASPPDARPALANAALEELPPGSLGPFGRYAVRLGDAEFCLQWPAPTGAPWLGSGPLPDVPVLAVNGGFDMRTPAAGAADIVSRFPQGRLIVVPGVGHSVVLGSDASFCSARAVRAWVLGTTFSTMCARPKPFVGTVPAFPSASRASPASPAQTRAIAAQTVHDAESIWLTSQTGGGARVAGVFGGRLVATEAGFRLQRYSITRGIEVSGDVAVTGFGPPFTFDGVLTVGGALAAPGLLGYEDGTLGGTLGGEIVGR